MKYSILTTAALLISGAAWAQGTLEDYNRAYGLREKYSPKSVYYSNVNPQWIEGTDCFWYIRNTPEGEEYVKVDASEKKRALLFDSNKLSASLAASTSKEIDPMQLPIRGCRVSQSLDTLRFVFEGKRWCFDITHNKLTEEGNLPAPGPQRHWMERDDEKEGAPVTSPDGKYVAFIKNDKATEPGRHDGKLLLIVYLLVARLEVCSLLPHPPYRETVCILRGIITSRPASAQTAQARIRQTGR